MSHCSIHFSTFMMEKCVYFLHIFFSPFKQDRYHVKYHQLPSLEDAGLRYFKTIVFDAVKNDVTAAIVDLINTERNGGVIDKALIKSSIEIYESMGMNSLDAYVSDFETQLLEATQ